ncbi:MAG: hypothetical protein K6F01_05200 [Selenomonas sp.]|uniref:hypothetical protein n=1 Tax=Selenomonas sp. TaxID=2053611 RepID=UPI0025F5C08B|nr:hypothetical protein [Selenomonas sp.]MCR5438815.1 hypothetical protein [Selenomonas sp.]
MKDEQYIKALYEEALNQAADYSLDEEQQGVAEIHRYYAERLGSIIEIPAGETDAAIAEMAKKNDKSKVDLSKEPETRLRFEVDRIIDGAIVFSEDEYQLLLQKLAEFHELMDSPLYDVLQQTAWQILQALHPQLDMYELEGLLMEDLQRAMGLQHNDISF